MLFVRACAIHREVQRGKAEELFNHVGALTRRDAGAGDNERGIRVAREAGIPVAAFRDQQRRIGGAAVVLQRVHAPIHASHKREQRGADDRHMAEITCKKRLQNWK